VGVRKVTNEDPQDLTAAVEQLCAQQAKGIRLLELLPLPPEAGGGYVAVLQVPEGRKSTGPEVEELSERVQAVAGITRVVVNLFL
jgi:hypothetical protein